MTRPYHREYDDAVLLLVAIGLLRVWHAGHVVSRRVSGAFLVVTWLALLTPTCAFYDLPPAVVLAIQWTHTVWWLAVLVFLMVVAARWPDPTSAPTDDPTDSPAAVGAR